MKFIHTEDIHWGMCPDANKPRGKERVQAIEGTLRIVVEKVGGMDVDCLFISRDLFHRQPLMKDPKRVNRLFSTIPAVKVIPITGNHDHTRENSVLLNFAWNPNVTFIMDEALTSAYFENINTGVHDFSYHTVKIEVSLLEDIQVPLSSRIQILMAHGGDTTHLLIDSNNLELSPFSYIALGHIHKPHILADGKIARCGSPESLDLTETSPHGFYAEEIHPVARKLINLQFIPAASLRYTSLAVNVSRGITNGELRDRISDEIENRGSRCTYRFQIKDMRDPDIEFDLEQLVVRYRIAEIIGDSEPQYDFSAPFAEHSNDIIGSYIQTLQKEDMSPMERKALYYGVDALLRATDERN